VHDLVQGNLAGFDQEINVIGHQHVGVHDTALALSVMLDPIKVGDSVASIAKNITSVITPHDHMV
jgi:hypothetical protein